MQSLSLRTARRRRYVLEIRSKLSDMPLPRIARDTANLRAEEFSFRVGPSFGIRSPMIIIQNSIRAWNAIIRGELSPPKPTPRSPVGGDVVNVREPKPVCVAGLPGIPA
jgi:hypothetical protein